MHYISFSQSLSLAMLLCLHGNTLRYYLKWKTMNHSLMLCVVERLCVTAQHNYKVLNHMSV